MFGSYIVPEVNSLKKSETIIKKISKISRKSDMVICCDYGHNFLNDKIINSIKKLKKRIFVNAQINSSNFLYRSLEKYKM